MCAHACAFGFVVDFCMLFTKITVYSVLLFRPGSFFFGFPLSVCIILYLYNFVFGEVLIYY